MRNHERLLKVGGAWICALLLTAGVAAAEERSFGTPPGAGELVSIGELLGTPENYVDKVVRVEGLVVEVCPMRGCWMMLADHDEKAREIRVKVKDDVIVFPMDAKGRPAVAEGKFTGRELTLKETVEYLAHQAEEMGRPFDADSVSEPMTLYEIQGTGAVVR